MDKEFNTLDGYVCFLDLLGYSEYVKEGVDQQKILREILELFEEIREEVQIANSIASKSVKIKLNTFSDNMFFTLESLFKSNQEFEAIVIENIETDNQKLLEEIENILFFMEVLKSIAKRIVLKTNMFARGGFLRGEYYVDSKIAYGNALIKSYEMESKDAIYPRIIISNDIVNGLERYLTPKAFEKFIYKSKDGMSSINYLDDISLKLVRDKKSAFEFFQLHKNVLTKNINYYGKNNILQYKPGKDISILKKYIWAANYHNDIVNRNAYKNYSLDIAYNFNTSMNILNAECKIR